MSSRDKQDFRLKEFKKSIDSESARRKREENTNGIRKSAREESISKRRGIVQTQPNVAYEIVIPSDIQEQFQTYEKETLENKLKNLNGLVQALNSNEQALVFSALLQFRKLLSIHNNPPIDEVIECGVIPKFNQLLECGHPKVAFEAAWALTNIASGNNKQTLAVINGGSVPIFVSLLSSNTTDEVKEQCAWAIGNIAGDTVAARDYLLSLGAMQPLIKLFDSPKITLVQNVTWTVSNLCRGKPHPDFSIVSQCLPSIKKLLDCEDLPSEVYGDLCWALSYLTDGANEKIQTVIDSGVLTRLVELLEHAEGIVYTPALRAVGNIVTGDEHQTQAIVDLGAIGSITRLLGIPKKSIRKESCWALSNITAGNSAQIEAVISNPSTVSSLISLLSHSEFEIKKEACWALSNATNGTSQVIKTLCRSNLIKHFIDLLNTSELSILKIVLEGLINIVKDGEQIKDKSGINPYIEVISEYDETVIYELQHHSSKDVYKKAMELSQYLDSREYSDGENYEPNNFEFKPANVNPSQINF
ncbi:hypothetical protein DICPUDRAFT_53657 [Dictyostelium purpureum]|uniref:Importin subunit alpha n=1 Tax=Dictyostelium purpureum TaxID=5786 RepID=F0ZDT0_DICPU|nr:uncharacterized protein DICPUDRAFT_53657 [Dictyostelium purpureum]EGC37901.1 hypothetical protein DICPUDRAFT_53657 [Dictyostelium purpureum]|eukprot:XP_003285561.1 hypothetical protein DICPUDRAFT_53657 [Dictyostelium purpureum]